MESILSIILDGISCLTAVLALSVCLIFYAYIRWSHMPPGPTGLPYLGYYPFLHDKGYYMQLESMAKEYGDAFCFKCMGQLYVCLGSLSAVKEAHVTKSDCFAGRSMNFSIFGETFGGGVSFENGEKWKTLRKFFIQSLKDFSLSKETQETLMGDFLMKTVNTIKRKNGKNFDALAFFSDTCGKAVYRLLLSGTKVDDEDVKTFNEAYYSMSEVMLGKNMLLAGPLFKYVLPHFRSDLRRWRKSKLLLESVLTKIVQEHENDFDKDNIRDLIDCFLNERKDMEEKKDPRSCIFSEKALVHTLLQIIGDGGFSVGYTIAYILKEVAVRPEVQKEMQREVDDVVGRNRFPSWDDRSRMPYTNAVMYECFRNSDFFPAFPSLECTRETTVSGCRVPKGAITLVNFHAIFHDPTVYEQPEKFDPTRFLPNDEQKSRTEIPVFFGVGKRACIGESLVIMETFLFVTTVLQNFDLCPAEKNEENSSEENTKMEELRVMLRATPRASDDSGQH